MHSAVISWLMIHPCVGANLPSDFVRDSTRAPVLGYDGFREGR